MAWRERRKKILGCEMAVLLLAFIFTIIGVICDWKVQEGVVFHVVNDINGLSLVLLQIQATITIVTLTIIALLSGAINSSYFGVAVSSFYLEKKPFLLKQKVVILIEFVILAISIWAHIYIMYNLVLSLFMSSMVIIVLSIFEVYGFFKGKRKTINEIQEYVEFLFKNDKDFVIAGESFIDDWKEIAPFQSAEEFDKYISFFNILVRRLLKEQDIDELNSLTEQFVMFLLTHDTKACRIKGIKFTIDYYENLWLWINQHEEESLKIVKPICLLDRITHEFYYALSTLEAELVEELLDWERFSDCVIRVACWIGYDITKKSADVSSICSIADSLGYYLKQQCEKGNVVDRKNWERILADSYGVMGVAIPDDRVDHYREIVAIRDFCVCHGYLLNEHTELVKNGLFLDGIGNTYKIENEQFVLRIMLIHCFMYYIAFAETEQCVDIDYQNKIRTLLLDRDVICAIDNFYYRLSEASLDLTDNVGRKLNEILGRYELFPKHSNTKAVIIDSAVQRYYFFAVMFLEYYSFNKSIISNMLNVNTYAQYLVGSIRKQLVEQMMTLHAMFETEIAEDKNRKFVEELLVNFDATMKDEYKKQVIGEAASHQRKFEVNDVQKITEEKIKKIVSSRMNQILSHYDKPCEDIINYPDLKIFSIVDYTDFLGDNLSRYYSDSPISQFGLWLANVLQRDFHIQMKNRGKDISDASFRDLLEKKGFDILLGSSYVFGCENYEHYNEHKEYLNTKKCDFVPGMNVGIALTEGSLYVKLNDIKVDIYSPTIDEIGITKNEGSNLYSYETRNSILLNFEEKELREYIHDERKIVDIRLNVSVGIRRNDDKEYAMLITRKIEEWEKKKN